MAIFNSYVCLPEGSGIDKWFIVSAQLSGFWYSCGFRATEKKWLEKNTPSYRNLNKENEVFDLKVWGTHQFIWASSWNVSDDRSLKLQETRLQKQHASHLNHLKSLTIDCWLVGQKPSPNDFCTWTLHLVSDYKPWLSLNVSRRFFWVSTRFQCHTIRSLSENLGYSILFRILDVSGQSTGMNPSTHCTASPRGPWVACGVRTSTMDIDPVKLCISRQFKLNQFGGVPQSWGYPNHPFIDGSFHYKS